MKEICLANISHMLVKRHTVCLSNVALMLLAVSDGWILKLDIPIWSIEGIGGGVHFY